MSSPFPFRIGNVFDNVCHSDSLLNDVTAPYFTHVDQKQECQFPVNRRAALFSPHAKLVSVLRRVEQFKEERRTGRQRKRWEDNIKE